MSKIDWKRLPRAYFKLDMIIDALKDTRSDARESLHEINCPEEDKHFFLMVVSLLNDAIDSLEAANRLIESKYQ